jgi:branched-chain amino acid transport system permease protein
VKTNTPLSSDSEEKQTVGGLGASVIVPEAGASSERLDSRVILNFKLVLVAFIGGVLAIAFLPPFYISVLNLIGISSIVVIGLVLLTGVVGLTSFGQAAFVGLGAYTSAYLTTVYGWNAFASLPAALLLVAVAAILIGVITVRLSGHYLILGTIAWGISLYYIFGNTEQLGKYNGITNVPSLSVVGFKLDKPRAMCVVILSIVGLAMVLTSNLLGSRTGRALRTLRSPELAQSVGINVPHFRLISFVYAAILAGLSGWTYAHYLQYVSPGPFNLNASFDYIFMIVVGGTKYVLSAVAGPAFLLAIKAGLQVIVPGDFGGSSTLQLIAFGLIMLLVLKKAPEGLVPLIIDRVVSLRVRPANILPKQTEIRPDARQVASHIGECLLTVDNVSKNFGGLMALNKVSFSVKTGEILGLIGPNGAGKSTLFNIVSGLMPPSNGRIIFNDVEIQDLPPHKRACLGMARSFQHVQLRPGMSVLDNASLGTFTRGSSGIFQGVFRLERKENEALINEAWFQLDRTNLKEHAAEEATSLPLGKQRVLEIARALCLSPLLLMLDEPAAGLRFQEKATLAKLLRQLREEGITIVIVDHDMKFVMGLVDRLVVMDFGEKIAEGVPDEIRADSLVHKAYLGS